MVRECRPPVREPGEVLAGAPLDNGNVDPRQRQLARQHQPRRTSSGDHHHMVGHSYTPARIMPPAASVSLTPVPLRRCNSGAGWNLGANPLQE